VIKHLRLTLNLLSFIEGEQRFLISSEELNEFSSLLQVTGEEIGKFALQ